MERVVERGFLPWIDGRRGFELFCWEMVGRMGGRTDRSTRIVGSTGGSTTDGVTES